MANRCNPKCIYFPVYEYEKTRNYKYDSQGVKHSINKVCPICSYDDHLIKSWKECDNYKEFYNTKFQTTKDKVLVLLGKSAVGKDYVLNFLLENYNFQSVISHTTRPIRQNEINGRDYYFVSNKVFADMLKDEEFIETREYTTNFNGKQDIWYYGVSKKEFEDKKNKICIIDTKGLKDVVNYYGRENIIAIYLDADDKIREQRAKERGSYSQQEWDRRLKDDNKKFRKVDFDYKILNNSTKENLQNEILKVLKKENLI